MSSPNPPTTPASSRRGARALCLVATALLSAACAADAPEPTCLALDKDVSVNGGATYVAADAYEQAPRLALDGAASYRLRVTNCGSRPLSGVTVTDDTLQLTIDVGRLKPTESREFVDALGNDMTIDRVCASRGPRGRKSSARATAMASVLVESTESGAPARATELVMVEATNAAWLECERPPGCGDGDLDSGEECDDRNNDDYDACRNDCTIPVCGDGFVDPNEQCDDANDSDDDGCCNCEIHGCGNGAVDPGEECDDGNTVDGDGCRNDCTAPYCGDGIVDPGEQCDDGNSNDDDGCCDCAIHGCGNGELDPGEQCDDGNTNDDDGCRSDCTAPSCGDGTVDPGEQCDDGNDAPSDGCSPDCESEGGECALEIEQLCRAFESSTGDGNCDGKVVAMTLEYTGQGCGATTNTQSGKATCEGGAGLASPVSIVATDKKGVRVWGAADRVERGDRFTLTAANGGKDKLDADTVLDINDGLEVVRVHTSCSKPLGVGDQFGSLRVVSLTTTEGGTVTLPTGDPAGATECTVAGAPTGVSCKGKLSALMLRYVGGSCSATSQDQGGKLECDGDAGTAQPVRVVASEKADGRGKSYADQAGVRIGDVVTIAASDDGKKSLKADTFVSVLGASGATLQELKIHTSCSKPLALGDRFGAFEVVGFVGKDGSATLGPNIEYLYTVTNPGAVSVTVDIVDDQLGVIAEDLTLAPGESVTIVRTALITEDTTSTTTVVGVTPGGDVCEAATGVTVVVDDPPPPSSSCDDGKPAGVVFEYTGSSCAASTNDQNGKFECTGDLAGAASVSVSVGASDVTVSPGVVALGESFTMRSDDGDKLSAQSDIELRVGGDIVQTLSIHTSCSQRLEVGDQFGALRLMGLILAE